jgi:hypothetical protein
MCVAPPQPVARARPPLGTRRVWLRLGGQAAPAEGATRCRRRVLGGLLAELVFFLDGKVILLAGVVFLVTFSPASCTSRRTKYHAGDTGPKCPAKNIGHNVGPPPRQQHQAKQQPEGEGTRAGHGRRGRRGGGSSHHHQRRRRVQAKSRGNGAGAMSFIAPARSGVGPVLEYVSDVTIFLTSPHKRT